MPSMRIWAMSKNELEKLINSILDYLDVCECARVTRVQYDALLGHYFNKNQWQYYKNQFPLKNRTGDLKTVKVLSYGE